MHPTFKYVLALAAVLVVQSGQAFSLWPFSGGSETNKPQRLHALLADANDYIELAEDAALEGDAAKALENYKKAIGELDRVEFENPDRADKPEFAPLRNKRAACQAAMDSIRFMQINQNARPVAVTDTSELEKKYAELKAKEKKAKERKAKDEQGATDEEDETGEVKAEKTKTNGQKTEEQKADASDASKETPKTEEAKAESSAEEPRAEPKKPEPPKAEPKAEPPTAKPASMPNDFNEKLKTALQEVKRKEYAAADLLLEALLKEKPNDLNALVLRAAAQSGIGSYHAARRTLERAQRAHPRSYIPCYNLAILALKLGEGKESARQYYEMSREFGGPRDLKLEAKLQ